jgi:hypothetical protein
MLFCYLNLSDETIPTGTSDCPPDANTRFINVVSAASLLFTLLAMTTNVIPFF